MPAIRMGRATLAAAAACVLALAPNALARSAYDGSWSVTVSGNSGACDGLSYQYDVRIVNNVVRYSGGDASISGHVGPNGELSVHVSAGDNSANGSGHLSASYGRGGFRGRSASGTCSGNWTATKTGG